MVKKGSPSFESALNDMLQGVTSIRWRGSRASRAFASGHSLGLPTRLPPQPAIGAERARRLAEPSPLPPFATDAEAMRRAAIGRTPAAAVLPAYSRMIVDPRGRLWLTTCDPLDPPACTVRVLSPDGEVLGDYLLPRGFVLRDVIGHLLLGVSELEPEGRVVEVRAVPGRLRPGGRAALAEMPGMSSFVRG